MSAKKKINAYIKLQLPAGKANPSPPVGPALGQHGVNIMQFCKDFNARSAPLGDTILPVVITVYADRSFTFIMKQPPARAEQDEGRRALDGPDPRDRQREDEGHEYDGSRSRRSQHRGHGQEHRRGRDLKSYWYGGAHPTG